MPLKIEAKAKDSADIWLYGEIDDGGWQDSISAKSVIDELKKLDGVRNLKLHINSPGGSVFEGLAIYNSLKNHPAHVVTEIDGMALSIASIVALAGDEVRMAGNALYMIHNPWSMTIGDSKEMRSMADRLDIVRGSLLGTYAAKVGAAVTSDDISGWMDNETWFTAEEAKQYGFIDEVTNPIEVAAKFDFTRFKYKNAPKAVAVFATPEDIALRARVARMSMLVNKRRLANSVQAQN